LEDLGWLGLRASRPPGQQCELTENQTIALEALTGAGSAYRDGGAVRFRLPQHGVEAWEDLVRGSIKVPNSGLANPVLVRSAGTPTFFLASTVDDVDDAITHLVRVTPMTAASAIQRHLWRALGVSAPAMAHIPPVTGPAGKPVRSIPGGGTLRYLRERGIGPEAVRVYLARPQSASEKTPPLGLEEIIDTLDPRRVARRPFCFDQAALERLDRRQRDVNPRHPLSWLGTDHRPS
jgi:glutamyl-tRNA synthetase